MSRRLTLLREDQVINNRYRVVRTLGRGGMGEVYLVEDDLRDAGAGDRRLALKTMKRERRHEALQYFRHEFKALSELRHPNLAAVYDFGVIESEDLPFFTAEYVEGRDLLEVASGMALDALYPLVVQVCRALEYIHSRGLIHHDVKPENILVTGVRSAGDGVRSEPGPAAPRTPLTADRPDDPVVKLIDFGLVGRVRTDDGGKIPGTVQYIAPEIFRGQQIDRRSDLYSLGIVLYQIVTGEVPFDGRTQLEVVRSHMEQEPPPPRERNRDLPEAFDALIRRLLAKEPAERPASANAVITELNRFTGRRWAIETKATAESYILSGRLVGRDREFAELTEVVGAAVGVSLASLEDSRLARESSTTTTSFELPTLGAARLPPAIVGIVGEAGVGKSRLLQEVRVHAQLAGVSVLRGTTAEGDASYGPLVQALRQAVRLPEAEPLLARHGAELQRLLPEIAAGRDWPAPPPLEPREERFRLLHTVSRFLVDLSRRRPFLLYLADLHAADPATLDGLQYLARYLGTVREPGPRAAPDEGPAPERATDPVVARPDRDPAPGATALASIEDTEARARLLILATWRPDEAPEAWTAAFAELETAQQARRFGLAPLTLPDVRRLIVSMLGIATDPGPLARKLHDASGGNPYVIEEVMKGLVEEGVLTQRDGEWVVHAESLADLALPAQVTEAVARRLRRLPADARTALSWLAALARSATLDLCARLAGRPADDLLPVLEELVRRELLVRERPEGTVTYRIPHRPLRDAAYDLIPTDDRPAIHAAIAATLEAGREAVPDDAAEELAHHARLARDPARGPRYGLQAGAYAARIFANRRAIALYLGAADLMGADDPRRRNVDAALAPLYGLEGDFDEAVRRYGACLAAPGLTPRDAGRLHERIAELHRRRADFPAALRALAAGRAALPSDQPTPEAVTLLLTESAVRIQQGDLDGARANATQALAIADAVGSRATDTRIFNRLGHVHLSRGDVKEAIGQYRRSLEAAERERDAGGIATAHLSLGHAYMRAGDFQSALGYFRRSLEIGERIGDVYRIADTLNNLGVLYIEKGNFPAALDYQRQCLAIRERIGDQYGRAQTFSNLGVLHNEMGNTREALRAFEQSLEIRAAIGDQDGVALALGNLGFTAHYTGDYPRALDTYRRAVQLRDAAGRRDEQIQTRVNLGHFYLTLGALDAAAEVLAVAERQAAGGDLRQHAADVETAMGRLAMLRGQWPEAEQRLRRALDAFKELSNTFGICQAELAYAELAHEQGEPERALKFARDALKLAEEIRSLRLRVEGLLVLGRVEADLAHDAGATEQLAEAQRLAEASDFRECVREAHHRLGALLVDLARFDTAERHLLRAEEIAEQLSAGLPEPLRTIYREDPRRARVAEDLKRLRERMLDTRTEITIEQRATFKRRITDLETGNMRLLKILEINKALTSERQLPALLDLIMDGVIELTDAERGFLILREGVAGAAAVAPDGNGAPAGPVPTGFGEGLEVVAARNINREDIAGPEFRISHSIATQAMAGGHPVLVTNAKEDERFREQQSVEDLNLRSVCCFPLRARQGVIGAMYLDNRFRKGVFGERDLRVLEAFGDQAALALENARLHADTLRKADEIAALNAQLAERLAHTAADLRKAEERIADTQRELELRYDYGGLVGRDGGLREVCRVLDRVIPTEWPVVIHGESGTGKELIAKAIHFNGPRKGRAFVTENCAAIPETLLESELFGHVKGAFTGATRTTRGLFQAADGGTLFLDEIGEMSLPMQAKLLRVLQEGEVRPVGGDTVSRVDVRLLAATNRDLKALVEAGAFREDLYYRIANMEVALPPLRDRRQDIPELAHHFLRRAAEELGAAPPTLARETLSVLLDHDWPGNVRELENEMRRAVTLADGPEAGPDVLSARLRRAEIAKGVQRLEEGKGTLKEAMAEVEKALILRALEKNRWNKSATAQELRISRVGLHKKCAKYGIK